MNHPGLHECAYAPSDKSHAKILPDVVGDLDAS
jgi:hypothetical protein